MPPILFYLLGGIIVKKNNQRITKYNNRIKTSTMKHYAGSLGAVNRGYYALVDVVFVGKDKGMGTFVVGDGNSYGEARMMALDYIDTNKSLGIFKSAKIAGIYPLTNSYK